MCNLHFVVLLHIMLIYLKNIIQLHGIFLKANSSALEKIVTGIMRQGEALKCFLVLFKNMPFFTSFAAVEVNIKPKCTAP